jgi:hypothetical protein
MASIAYVETTRIEFGAFATVPTGETVIACLWYPAIESAWSDLCRWQMTPVPPSAPLAPRQALRFPPHDDIPHIGASSLMNSPGNSLP